MTKKRRENISKYFYNISQGIFLISVVSNLLKEKWDIFSIIFGIIATILFFIAAYIFDGGDKDE